jgi:F0F1-type ATP synthase assembly protein I
MVPCVWQHPLHPTAAVLAGRPAKHQLLLERLLLLLVALVVLVVQRCSWHPSRLMGPPASQ